MKYEKEIKQKFIDKGIGIHHFGDIDQQQAVEKAIDELIDETYKAAEEMIKCALIAMENANLLKKP